MATIDTENAKNIRTAMLVYIEMTLPNNTTLTIKAEDLISCVVSLRSDLSRINPTLPESEIEIEAYWPTDISTQVANIPEGTKLTYKAGYTQNYSDTRYFYVDEQVTWTNKILHIHAVDQVNKLDGELPPIFLGQVWDGGASKSDGNVLNNLYSAFKDIIQGTADGTNPPVSIRSIESATFQEGTFSSVPDGGALNSLLPRGTRRELIAKLMNICHWDLVDVNNQTNFWPTFVDAGKVTVRATHPGAPTYTIYESDCGDVKISKERQIKSLTVLVNKIQGSGSGSKQCSGVSATIFKQQGIALSYSDCLLGSAHLGLSDEYQNPNEDYALYYYWIWQRKKDIQKRSRPYSSSITYNDAWLKANKYGIWLIDDQVETQEWNPGGYSFIDLSGAKWTSPMTDTGPETPASEWQNFIDMGLIDASATSFEMDNRGFHFITTDESKYTKTRLRDGMDVVLTDDIFWTGHAKYRAYDDSSTWSVLPSDAVNCILNKSNVVGSFKWKGDPRLQPRDFINFVRLDNTSEVWTIENITLTHEGGGTSCEMTMRKGYI